MKKLFTLAALLFGMMSSAMADDIKIATYGNASGTSRTVTVALNRTANYVACQFDLTLPAGTTVTKITPKAPLINDGKVDLSKAGGDANESTNFVVDFNQEGTTCKVIAYNLGNVAIGGASGDVLMTVELTSSAVNYNDESVTVDGITFVNTELAAAPAMAPVKDTDAPKKLWGDVNNDKAVSLTDINQANNVYLNKSNKSSLVDSFAGDFDSNDIITISDINKINNIYLNK